MIMRPWISSNAGSDLGLRIVAFRALNSFLADRSPNELPNGPRDFHSLDEDDSFSLEVDKLSSDSDSKSPSSDEELDYSDAASISATSATALCFGDYVAFPWNLSLGYHREEFHVEFHVAFLSG